MNTVPPKGTKIRTNPTIGASLPGLHLPHHMIANRKPDTEGIVTLGVPGTGMEVFYVAHGPSLHNPDPTAVYCIDEFEEIASV